MTAEEAEEHNRKLQAALLEEVASGFRSAESAILHEREPQPDIRALYAEVSATLEARYALKRKARVQAKRGLPAAFRMPNYARVTTAEAFVRVAQLRYGFTDEEVARALYPGDKDRVAKMRRIRHRLRQRRQWMPIP